MVLFHPVSLLDAHQLIRTLILPQWVSDWQEGKLLDFVVIGEPVFESQLTDGTALNYDAVDVVVDRVVVDHGRLLYAEIGSNLAGTQQRLGPTLRRDAADALKLPQVRQMDCAGVG